MNPEIRSIVENMTIFPILVDNNDIIEGNLWTRPMSCLNCISKECQQANFSKKFCSNGFRVLDLNIPNENLKFIGIITSISKNALPNTLQKKYSSKTLDEKDLLRWASKIQKCVMDLKQIINTKQREYIDGFHDITPNLTLIIRNAEEVIKKSGGISMEDKFENSQPEIQTLYKSAEVLNQQLRFMSYLTNPDSIKYGNKRPTTVYKLIDKMRKIFKQAATKKHIDLKIEGNSYNTPKVYDSFGILIFILLENAIKYSYNSQDIVISIKDLENHNVAVDFMSYGPIIPEGEKNKIFDKYYRYVHASLDSDKIRGHGLGLYIASLIASKHGFKIEYSSEASTASKNGTSIGENHFSFEIPSDTES